MRKLSRAEAGKLGGLKGGAVSRDRRKDRAIAYQQCPSVCQECNQPLPYEKKNNTYCSKSCSAISANRRLNRIKRKESACKQCGTIFKYSESQADGLFCGRNCYNDYRILLVMKSGQITKGNAITYLKRFADYKCNCCGIEEWHGKPLRLQIDHINGDKHNHSIENIQWLCPNCHTQTDTWGAKNAGPAARQRILDGARKGAKNSPRTRLSIQELEHLSSNG